MKASELIAKLEAMVAEKGDLDLYTFAGDEGMELLEAVEFVRVRQAHATDYFFESATEKDEERLHHGIGFEGLGKFKSAPEDEPHAVGIYIGR